MAEIYVTSTADSGAGSLRQAIADASDGDVILFDTDVFPVGATTSILLSSYITINKSVSIYGGFSDGAGGYTSGAVKSYYVYREVEGVKTKVYIDDDNPAQEGETVLFENVCRVALDGQEAVRAVAAGTSISVNLTFSGVAINNSFFTSGGGYYSGNASQCTLNDCNINSCTATNNGGGVFSTNTSHNTLNGCNITNCTAANGGGVYSAITSQNTLTDCTFTSCTATNGGGVYSGNTSQNTLNDCTITGCSATSYGGGVYSGSTAKIWLNNCSIESCSAGNGGGVSAYDTSEMFVNNCAIFGNETTSSEPSQKDASIISNSTGCINNSRIGSLRVNSSASLTIKGIVIADLVVLLNSSQQSINIDDGAALTVTQAMPNNAATFTSEGRGYLAVAAGINTSAVTLTNVVLCAYGADVSSFAEVDGILEWEAANPTTTVLIERADGDSWTTVAQPTGESLTLYLPPSDTVRLFDGVQFFTATAPSQRTYYYIGGAEGSFTSAADWSLRRGGVAITEPPVVAGQRFVVGDISSGE